MLQGRALMTRQYWEIFSDAAVRKVIITVLKTVFMRLCLQYFFYLMIEIFVAIKKQTVQVPAKIGYFIFFQHSLIIR